MIQYLNKQQTRLDGSFKGCQLKNHTSVNTAEQVLIEKNFILHVCEKKRRHLQKGKTCPLGYYAFTRFYKLSAGTKTDKTYEQFCDSPTYNAFVKFGSWVNNVKSLYTERYIDWVVTSGVKLDHWCRDELYEKYVNEFVLKESMETAVERTIQTMMDCPEKEAPE